MNKKLFGEGALLGGLALIGLASKRHGSRSVCSACHTQQASLIDMAETISSCNYNLPEVSQVLEQLVSPGRGSFAKEEDKDIRKAYNMQPLAGLEEARRMSVLNKADYQRFQAMLAWMERKYPDLFKVAERLIGDATPQQIKLFGNIGATLSSGGRYMQGVKLLKLAESVGVRNFINRYLQRVAILVPPHVNNTPLMQNPEDWRYEWTCAAMRKPIEDSLASLGKALRRIGLDLNETRATNVYDKKRGRYTEQPLKKIGGLKNLSMVAWFIAVAKACGVTKGSELLFTYPVENVFTARGNIGDTVFTRLSYRMHLPGPSASPKAFPDTYREFKVSPDTVGAVLDEKLSQPYLYYYDRQTGQPVTIVYYSYTAGALSAERSPIFTVTEKMNAPSFSIPAGAPQAGGSCIASLYTASNPGMGVHDSTFVCRKCYALKGHYMYLSYVFSAAPRMNWLVENCRADLTGERMAGLLALAIESYARYGVSKKRAKLEFGFIRNQSLIYPVGDKTYSRFDSTPLVVGGTSQDFIDFSDPSTNNAVAGFFRIHDSGDFTISNHVATNLSYINSWGMIASAFEHVRFWAPTRAWTLGYSEIDLGETIDADAAQAAVAQLESGIGSQTAAKLGIGRLLGEVKNLWAGYVLAMNSASELNPNLAIRPSGLTIISPFTNSFIKVPILSALDPRIQSVAAGSGVNAVVVTAAGATQKVYTFTEAAFELVGFDTAFPPYTKGRSEAKKKIGDFLRDFFVRHYGQLPKHSYTPVRSMDGTPVYQCPVNLDTSPDGNPRSSADSCLGSNCRVCWLKKETPVTYGAH